MSIFCYGERTRGVRRVHIGGGGGEGGRDVLFFSKIQDCTGTGSSPIALCMLHTQNSTFYTMCLLRMMMCVRCVWHQ